MENKIIEVHTKTPKKKGMIVYEDDILSGPALEGEIVEKINPFQGLRDLIDDGTRSVTITRDKKMKCPECGRDCYESELEERFDPYILEIHGDKVEVSYCDECYHEACMEI